MLARILPLLTLAIFAGVALIFYIDPDRAVASGPGCAMQKTTGIHCPGCGGTRAVGHIARGDFLAAASSNLVVFIFFPVVLYSLISYSINIWTRWRVPYLPTKATPWIVLGVLMLIYAILRNLPMEPFSHLAP